MLKRSSRLAVHDSVGSFAFGLVAQKETEPPVVFRCLPRSVRVCFQTEGGTEAEAGCWVRYDGQVQAKEKRVFGAPFVTAGWAVLIFVRELC